MPQTSSHMAMKEPEDLDNSENRENLVKVHSVVTTAASSALAFTQLLPHHHIPLRLYWKTLQESLFPF